MIDVLINLQWLPVSKRVLFKSHNSNLSKILLDRTAILMGFDCPYSNALEFRPTYKLQLTPTKI